MGIALMAHVPNNSVSPKIEDLVERNRELHHTEVGCEMSAALRDHLNDFFAEFFCQYGQIIFIQSLEVIRSVDLT
jgi:hypothetical protein